MIEAGALNRRLTIYAPSEARSSTGTPKTGWRRVADVWASRESLNLREASRMGGRTEGAEASFVIRYRDDVTTQHEVLFNGRRYSVVQVDELGNREGTKLLVRSV